MRTASPTFASPRLAALAALAALAFVAACATAHAPGASPETTPAVLIDQSGRVYRTSDSPTAATFATPPDSTFKAVVAAYTALGFEPTTVDPSQRLVGRQRMVLRSRFDGKPLSDAFDCGTGQFGPRANDGRITADITSYVAASGTGSVVSTTVTASLTPNDGVSRDPIRCESHGRLEESLRREISTRLGVPYERP